MKKADPDLLENLGWSDHPTLKEGDNLETYVDRNYRWNTVKLNSEKDRFDLEILVSPHIGKDLVRGFTLHVDWLGGSLQDRKKAYVKAMNFWHRFDTLLRIKREWPKMAGRSMAVSSATL